MFELQKSNIDIDDGKIKGIGTVPVSYYKMRGKEYLIFTECINPDDIKNNFNVQMDIGVAYELNKGLWFSLKPAFLRERGAFNARKITKRVESFWKAN